MSDNLESILREFADRIRTAARQEMLEVLSGGMASGTARAARTPARTGARGRKGQKRDPKALAALTAKLGSVVQSKPGLRIEQIAKVMGVRSKDLALPAKKLIAAKSISTKGNRRATKYFPK